MKSRFTIGIMVIYLLPMLVWAHGTENHSDEGISVPIDGTEINDNLPIQIKNEFSLINHLGESVSQDSYTERHKLVFFGYVNCKNMCSITLKRIGDALNILEKSFDKLA